ncbi:hypothetical protein DFP72DRAFT_879134 [Ephemerocybe angulata]|uniref:Tetratricopeptide repeat protein 15 n=1 Tax=Ephemerocybe angulata TaxID=980116 RepID=A0A8H6MD91_9AGAR|nr:hypothetical protein DFP72DRAFT_879134 [Tulosesus angulatus]
MPNLLKKKRRSSTSAAETHVEEKETQQHSVAVDLASPPSPSSSRTAYSRSSISFSTPSTPPKNRTRRQASDASTSTTSSTSTKVSSVSAGSSPLGLKVAKLGSPMKSIVKRQIQRLDSALHQPKPRSKLHPASIFPSFASPKRPRTVSTVGGPSDDKQRPPRNRTVSLPFLPRRRTSSSGSSKMASPQLDSAVRSLPPLEEENGARSATDSVFGSSLPVPSVHVEEDVPDPFLVDDEGDALSSEDGSVPAPASPAPAQEVSLSLTPSPSPLPSAQLSPRPLLSPNVNKDVPPPPVSDSEDDDDDAPELYLPGLIIPTMFLPIPNTDPLTVLLNKYIYPPEIRPVRDVSGEWQNSDFHTLVMTNSWRALARMARDRIAECTNLFSVLTKVEPPEAREYLFERILPFELEVMQTRLKYWAGDHMGYLDALAALLRKCKVNAKGSRGKPDDSGVVMSMWKERGARVTLIIASQMVEMKEFTAAARLLEPLCRGNSSPALRSAIARIYLQGGNLHMAAQHFATVDADPVVDERQKSMNAALLASAQGEWECASGTLKGLIEKDDEDYVVVNNLAVALLNQGKLKEAIDVLEKALKASPSSVVVAEPFLFNLSTLYELRSSIGFANKRDLLVEVAKWSGDGLKTTCLKLPTN